MTNTSGEPVPTDQAVRYFEWARDHHENGAELDDPRTARRLVVDEARALGGPAEPVYEVEDFVIGSVPTRLYRPDGAAREVLVWIHGGGWIAGDIECYDTQARAIANRAGCSVLSFEYRLAPEHPYPAGLDDCWSVLQWAALNFDNVAVAGDSAGGNLAAAVALRARDSGVPVALQLLIYPVLDYRPDSPGYAEFVERYRHFAGIDGFGRTHAQLVQNGWLTYIPEEHRRREAYAAPFQAESLRDVAPALILIAEHDILRDECYEYADRLRADGAAATVHEYAGQIHGFFRLPGIFPDAIDAIDRSATALRAAFAAAASTAATPT
jgi:acetyl esterase